MARRRSGTASDRGRARRDRLAERLGTAPRRRRSARRHNPPRPRSMASDRWGGDRTGRAPSSSARDLGRARGPRARGPAVTKGEGRPAARRAPHASVHLKSVYRGDTSTARPGREKSALRPEVGVARVSTQGSTWTPCSKPNTWEEGYGALLILGPCPSTELPSSTRPSAWWRGGVQLHLGHGGLAYPACPTRRR